MKIENTIEVDAPLDRVWALVNDIPRVAPCMPGAALTGVLDDQTYEGTVAVKLLTAAFGDRDWAVRLRASMLLKQIDSPIDGVDSKIRPG